MIGYFDTNKSVAIEASLDTELFAVNIPYLSTMTLDQMRATGVRLSGYSRIDNDLQNQLVPCYLTINAMLSKWVDGTDIRISKYEDVLRIFDVASEFIYYWKEKISRGINIGGAPFDKLIALDRFIAIIHPEAKYQFTDNDDQFPVTSYLKGLNTLNKTIENKVPIAKPGMTGFNKEPYDPSKLEHDSLAHFFKSQIGNIRR